MQFKEKFVTELTLYDSIQRPLLESSSSSGDKSQVDSASPNPATALETEAELVTTMEKPSPLPGRRAANSGRRNSEDNSGYQFPLGLYLSTERNTGCHFIYKVSPISLLAPMKLKYVFN